MNAIYKEHPALWKRDTDASGFSWIDADDRGGNVFSWLRYDGEGQMIACIINFSSQSRARTTRSGCPRRVWKEILNTDAEVYDGTGLIGNRTSGRSSRAVARLCGIRLRHHPPAWCGVAAAGTRAG